MTNEVQVGRRSKTIAVIGLDDDAVMEPIGGKRSYRWVVEAAARCSEVDQVFVCGDESRLADLPREDWIEPIVCPTDSLRDASHVELLPRFVTKELDARGVGFEVVVRLDAATPETTCADIARALEFFRNAERREVFSIDDRDIENGVLRVMHRDALEQRALTVYAGIVHLPYLSMRDAGQRLALEKRMSMRLAF